MYMDTDSMYMSITAEKLEDLIKPEMKDIYEKEKICGYQEMTQKSISCMTIEPRGFLKLSLLVMV